ncbi:10727_t:CDS:2, partial [Gigaspora margarita]
LDSNSNLDFNPNLDPISNPNSVLKVLYNPNSDIENANNKLIAKPNLRKNTSWIWQYFRKKQLLQKWKNEYMGITCYFIDSNYKLKEILLAVRYVSYSHDTRTIQTELENIINNWKLSEKHNKAVSLLQEKYNLFSVENELVANLTNKEENENQMNLFSIMFGLDKRSTLVKNEVDQYLKIDQFSSKYLAIPATLTSSEWLISNADNLMIAK